MHRFLVSWKASALTRNRGRHGFDKQRSDLRVVCVPISVALHLLRTRRESGLSFDVPSRLIKVSIGPPHIALDMPEQCSSSRAVERCWESFRFIEYFKDGNPIQMKSEVLNAFCRS